MKELFDQYPKAVNLARKDKHGRTIFVPLVYPAGHDRHGEFVIWENARAEADYDGTGVPADTRPEMHSQPAFDYNEHWQLWFENKSSDKKNS
jgi:hypothetical protein